MNQRKLNEYDILKAFAIFLVVIGHITIGFNPDTYSVKSTRFPELLTSGIYLFHMPLFMAVSGAVYELNRKKFTYRHFIPFVVNKLQRVIVPYYFVGLVALLPVMVYVNHNWNWCDPKIWFKILLAEDCRHLWYLLALFEIFIVQYWVDKAKIKLWLMFCMACIITLSLSWYTPNFKFMCISMAARDWPSFILGMIMVRYLNAITYKRTVFLSLIGGGICIIGIKLSHEYHIDMILSLILPFFICAVLIVAARQITLSKHTESVVRWVVGYSFGIYLFHISAIYLVRYWLIDRMEMYTLMGLMFVVSIAVSVWLTWLLRRLKFGFLIGE